MSERRKELIAAIESLTLSVERLEKSIEICPLKEASIQSMMRLIAALSRSLETE